MLKKLIVLSWKSWVGKSTHSEILNERLWLNKLKNCTSRPKRPNSDLDYEFYSKSEMIDKYLNNEFIEFIQFDWNLYGIPRPSQEIGIITLDPLWYSQIIKDSFLNNYQYLSIYLNMPTHKIIKQLVKRWDKEEDINRRIKNDWYMDWFRKLYDFDLTLQGELEKDNQKIFNYINDWLNATN